jgi:hypothetical protein
LPYFDGKFVCLGRCVDGEEVLRKLEGGNGGGAGGYGGGGYGGGIGGIGGGGVETRYEKPVGRLEVGGCGVLWRP